VRSNMKRIVRFTLAVALVAVGSRLALWAQLPQPVNTWASLGSAPQARTGAAAVALADGRTLIIGGRTADGVVTDSVVVYDPTVNQTLAVGQLTAHRIGHSATLLRDGRVLIAGGSIDNIVSGELEIFDPATGLSTVVASLSQPRTRHAAARLFGGSVLIAGGNSPVVGPDGSVAHAASDSAELFDPSTNGVTPVVAALTTPRAGASATTLIDGRVLIAGGNNAGSDLKSAELFDPFDSQLFRLVDTELSVARTGHAAMLLPHNNSVLIAGGTTAGEAVTAADLFVPAEFPDPYSYGIGHLAPTGAVTSARARANMGPSGDNGYAFVMGGGPADSEVYRFATIKTDKDDYAPGENAVITGSGWQPGQDVTLVFQEDPAVHEDYVLTVTADNQGNFEYSQWAPEHHDIGVRFYLSAHDSKSRAQITFTDAPKVGSVAIGSQTPSPVPAGESTGTSASYSITVNRGSGGGSSGAFTAALSITSSLPAGATATFTPNPVSFTSSQSSRTATLVIATTSATPGGSTSFTVRAATSTQDFATNTANLVVTAATRNTNTSVVCSPASVLANQATSCTATVTDINSGPTSSPAGNVNFSSSATGAFSSTSCILSPASASSSACSVTYTPQSPTTGTHNVGASYAGYAPHVASSGSPFALTLGQSSQTITVTTPAPATAAYNAAFGVAATASSGLAVSITASGGCSVTTGGSGSGTITMTSGTTACLVKYDQAGNANFTGAPQVTNNVGAVKASATLALGNLIQTYDGSSKTATATTTPADLSGVTLTYNGSPTPPINAGSYAVVATLSHSDYQAADATGTLVINKAIASVVLGAMTWTYTGSALMPTATTTPANMTVVWTNAPQTNAGTYTVTATVDDANYQGSANGSFVVNRATATVTVNGHSGVYDGAAHGASGSATGVMGEDLSTLLNLGASFTSVPGGTAHWTFAGDTNYKPASGDATITITQADAVIAVTGYSGVFDGASHGATGSATGVAGEPLSALLNLGAAFTNVPGGTAHWTFAGDTNHKPASGDATITITQADAVIAVTGYSGVFDGAAHGATGTATGVAGEPLSTLLNLGATFTSVPGGTAHWTFAGDTNHKPASGDATITITQADAAIVVNGQSGVYDGAAHGATGSATGVTGEDLGALLNLGDTFVNVPGGTAHWTFAGNTNYKPASGDVTITITQADAIISVNGATHVYNGAAHGATGTATGVTGEDLSALLTFGDTFTNVPGGTAHWTFAGDTNYMPGSGDVTIVITQATANVVVNGYYGVYDGAAEGATGTATGVQGEDLSSLLDLGATFTNVPGGTATWSFGGNVNYSSAGGTVEIVINKASLSATAHSTSKVYGEPNPTFTGTLTGVAGSDPITATYSTTATTTSGVGSYDIVPAVNATASVLANYETPLLTNGTLTIGKAALTVTADAKSKTYGNVDPSLTYQITAGGLVGTDQFSGAITRTAGENVGVYPILQGSLALNDNYNLYFAGADFAVTKRSLKIKADAKTKAFGATDPSLTYQLMAGTFVNGDSFTGSLTRATGEAVGTYTINQGTVTAGGNYEIEYVSATFTITAWHVVGFHQPIGLGNTIGSAPGAAIPWVTTGTIWNTIKGGSTVPIKFNLYSTVNGTELTSVSSVQGNGYGFALSEVGCTPGPQDEVEAVTTTGGTTLRYDGSQFIQNWQTPRGASKCYRITLMVQDGSRMTAFFRTK
jgi:hypothetical protein